MNIELLLRVKQSILDEPKRVDMLEWATPPTRATKHRKQRLRPTAPSAPPCNTVGCIAGWTILNGLKDPARAARRMREKLGFEGYAYAARIKLGLLASESDRLFFPRNWPERFERRLNVLAPGTPEYAQVVADRIDCFIASNGAE